MVPSKSTSTVITTGFSVGGGGVPTGMLRLTECSWIGIVMISITSNTSITSISGVVLISTITSGSCEPPPEPTFIAIARLLALVLRSTAARGRFGHKSDLLDAGSLRSEHNTPDELVAASEIAADVHLRLRLLDRHLLQALQQIIVVAHGLQAPEDVAVLGDRDFDVFGLGLPRDVGLLRQLQRNRLGDYRNCDQEDDQQHQHHVDQRRGVDGRYGFVLAAFGPDIHCHGWPPSNRRL